MRVEIYADVVFFINLIMDLFVFWTAGRLLGKKTRFRRLLFGAAISAFLYCIIIFLPIKSGLNFFLAMGILMLGVAAAFKPSGVKEFLKLVFLAHLSAFIIGGIAYALYFNTNKAELFSNLFSLAINKFSLKLLITATAASYVVIKLISSAITKMSIHKQVFCPVKIFLNDGNAEFNVLVDTGNSLYDPLTNSPVLIAEFREIKNILPDNIKLIFYEHKENDLAYLLSNIINTELSSRIRMIPFSSIGRQNGMIVGFRPDKVIITNDVDIETHDVVIGIYNSTLSRDGIYRGLLNPALLRCEK